MKKNLIILGNGGSCKDIDYTRLPKEYDIYRCNQFYFEDKYYMGNHVHRYFMTPHVFLEQYYTLQTLMERKEYIVDDIVLSTFSNPCIDGDSYQYLLRYFPQVINGYDRYLSKLPELDRLFRNEEIFHNNRITSGVYMCICGIVEGYENIYIAGLDFYRNTEKEYAFNHSTDNLGSLIPAFKKATSKYNKHSESFDVEILLRLQKQYDVNFYSITTTSPVNEYIALAEKNDEAIFVGLTDKPKDYIADILLPPKEVYRRVNIRPRRDKMISNICFKGIKDFFSLGKDIIGYYKEKNR